MTTTSNVALKAQVDVLAAVLHAVCGTLQPEQAQAVEAALRTRLVTRAVESEAVDEARAEVLAPLLAALRH